METLARLGDAFRGLNPVVHVLLLVPMTVGACGLWVVVLYRVIYIDRRDDFSCLIKFMFTQDPNGLVIPTPSHQAASMWRSAYLVYLAWRTNAIVLGIFTDLALM